MDQQLVWNPLFDRELATRVLAQLNTYYQSAAASSLAKDLQTRQGQRFEDVATFIRHHIGQNQITRDLSSSIVRERLHLADQAIKETKALLPFGAGNQLETVMATHGNASQRMTRGKNVLTFGQEMKEQMGAGPASSTGSVALVAAVTQGGSCRSYAALVYESLCRQGVSPDDLRIWSMSGGDHVFIILGDPASEEAVAADAWPTHTQALLWKDHFAYGKEQRKKGTLFAGPSQKLKRPDPVIIAQDLIKTEEQPRYELLQYVPCASAHLSWISYDTQKPWPPLHDDMPAQPRNLDEEVARLKNT
jgi:hypothetical protein